MPCTIPPPAGASLLRSSSRVMQLRLAGSNSQNPSCESDTKRLKSANSLPRLLPA